MGTTFSRWRAHSTAITKACSQATHHDWQGHRAPISSGRNDEVYRTIAARGGLPQFGMLILEYARHQDPDPLA
jgi:hypothetical protein